MSLRPCFLVVDQEHAGTISTRKLVLETAKFNVITAFSWVEAVEVLRRFPRVHGVVIDSVQHDTGTDALFATLASLPDVKLIVVGQPEKALLERKPDLVVESFSPQLLLNALQRLFPEHSAYLQQHEERLEGKRA